MWSTLGFFLATVALVAADTPANCTFEELAGTWIFQETARTGGKDIDCLSNTDAPKNPVKITLQHFDTAVDEYGNEGTWTIIYNQGLEVTVNNRVYFFFSKYTEDEKTVTSYCDQTLEGWSHDVLGNNWACFLGQKTESVPPKTYNKDGSDPIVHKVFTSTDEYVATLNSVQKSWQATKYERFEGMSREELNNMAGGSKSRLLSFPEPDPSNRPRSGLRGAAPLPDAFDWRDVDGVNYVPDVRDQASCGSCYIFASMGMLEARIRVLTDNKKQPLLSPQYVLSCSKYSQGCNGGFPYLIAGKFAQDYGLVEDEYFPYEAKDTKCVEPEKSPRHYVADYDYVGGYYGGCNEEEMMRSLVEEGPVAVGFQVWDDFRQYKTGVYHHTGVHNTAVQGSFNPFYEVNHAVLVVGYGVEEATGEKYWTVMNSWGAEWGDHGYFKILRGVNECGIESLAVRATPIA